MQFILIAFLVLLAFVGIIYLFNILAVLSGVPLLSFLGFTKTITSDPSTVAQVFDGVINVYKVLAVFMTLLFSMIYLYYNFKISEVKKTKKLERTLAERKELEAMVAIPQETKKWQKIMEHVSSANPSDWRLCILEADVLLDQLLSSLGYEGDGIAEKLKKAKRSDFSTLDSAWEAHKIRNAIAHEGSDFAINQQEARRVINLFQSVFLEFKFI